MFPSITLLVCELCEYFEIKGVWWKTPENQKQTLSYPLHYLYCFS